jgi:hypothetical protein
VPAAGLAGATPTAFQAASGPTAAADRDGRTVEAVEVLRVSGPIDIVPGENRQFQVNPLHIYDARRPAPYQEPPPGTST